MSTITPAEAGDGLIFGWMGKLHGNPSRRPWEDMATLCFGHATRKSPARNEAKHWLLDVLKKSPIWADEIWEAAKPEGFSVRTIKRAKEEVGIVSERAGFGRDGKSYWRLPEHIGKTPEHKPDTPLFPLLALYESYGI